MCRFSFPRTVYQFGFTDFLKLFTILLEFTSNLQVLGVQNRVCIEESQLKVIRRTTKKFQKSDYRLDQRLFTTNV